MIKLPRGSNYTYGVHPQKCTCGLWDTHDGRTMRMRDRLVYVVQLEPVKLQK